MFDNSRFQDSEAMGVIYRIWNKRNGKSYIGQSINDASARVRRHLAGDGSKEISLDLHRYDKTDWCWEILEEIDESADSSPSLNERERYYIHQYNSVMAGYNLTYGEERDKGFFIDLTQIEGSDDRIREAFEPIIKLGVFPGVDSIDVFMQMRQEALDDLEIYDAIEEFSKAMEEKLDEIRNIINDSLVSLNIRDDISKRLKAQFTIEYNNYTKSFSCSLTGVTVKENS